MADTFYDPKKNEEYQKALEKLEAALRRYLLFVQLAEEWETGT